MMPSPFATSIQCTRWCGRVYCGAAVGETAVDDIEAVFLVGMRGAGWVNMAPLGWGGDGLIR